MAEESVTLHTGQKMPLLGLGTWLAKKGEVGEAVRHAITEAGYRHIDCASNYLNEDEIGDVVQEVFKEGNIQRKDVFFTGKLNNPYHHREHVRPHCEKSLLDLGIGYFDLYLIHWPVAFKYVPYDGSKRGYHASYDPNDCSELEEVKKGESKIDMTVSLRETWVAMEQLVDAGLCKSIGLSNVTGPLLHDLLTYARIKPAVIQNEMHPLCQQPALCAYAQRMGIVMEAYSPLGAGGFRKQNEPSVIENPTLIEIARTHNKTPAQVALRWATQRGTVAIPKSIKPQRLRENINIFDFKLSDAEMESISKLDINYHYLRPNNWYRIPLFTP